MHTEGAVQAKPERSERLLPLGAWALFVGLSLTVSFAPRQVEAAPRRATLRASTETAAAGAARCRDDRRVIVVCEARSCAVVPQRAGRAAQTLTDGVEVEAPAAELPERLGDTSQEEFPWERRLITFEVNPDPPETKLPPSIRALLAEQARKPHVKHHIFPQEFKLFFEKNEIKIHSWVMVLPLEDHLRIHRGELGGPWNADWRAWIKNKGRTANSAAIYQFAGEMIYRYCLSGTMTRYYCDLSLPKPERTNLVSQGDEDD